MIRRSLPWQVAWITPGLIAGGFYALVGAEPLAVVIGGLVGGVLGLLGALGFELARVLSRPQPVTDSEWLRAHQHIYVAPEPDEKRHVPPER